MPDRYGATPERWRFFAEELGLTADLLPVVSNPHATISPASNMQKVGKTPSIYNQQGNAAGIPKWTQHVSSPAEVRRWMQNPDYGISVICRTLRAVDGDIADPDLAARVAALLRDYGDPMIRSRPGTGKFLMPFWHREPLTKHVFPVEGGIVEILADGQQFVAEGTHEDGTRYEWTGSEIPELDAMDVALLRARLTAIATGPVKVARERGERLSGADLGLVDDVATWLVENWETYDAGSSGQLFIACPFADGHSTDTGPSSTAYFPAGTGGYSEGHFVCLHASCSGRGDGEFLNATGYTTSQFASLPDDPPHALPSPSPLDDADRPDRQALIEAERWPRLTRDDKGKIEATMHNLLGAISSPAMIGRHIAYDAFKDIIMWAPAEPVPLQWRALRDVDYALIRQQLELRGFKPMSADAIRLAVLAVADRHEMDTAKEWLSRLEWDGVDRITGFAARGWGWEPSEYASAVSHYVWTALAGRILSPGCQADMAPVLIGPQGARKTSAIKAMAPAPEFYAEINLAERGDDTSRKMRGTLVAELEELRGLSSKASEEIKAFISRTHEEWTPKWREFATKFPRRLLFFGTGNDEQFLSDPTGERRWLPGRCDQPIDVDWIDASRNQLWAQGAALYRLDGIDWRDAERLAKKEHAAFKVSDAWEPHVIRWLNPPADAPEGLAEGRDFLTIAEALTGAIGIPAGQVDRGREMRMGRVLKGLGLERVRRRVDGALVWGYEKPGQS